MCCTPSASYQPAVGPREPWKQLGVEELIPEPAVERLRKAVLPRGSGLDVRHGGGARLAPAP